MHLHSITHWECRKELTSGVKKKQTQCSVEVTREDELQIFQVVTHSWWTTMDLWECVCASSVCLLDIIASPSMYSYNHACPCVVSLSGFCSSTFQDDDALEQLPIRSMLSNCCSMDLNTFCCQQESLLFLNPYKSPCNQLCWEGRTVLLLLYQFLTISLQPNFL